VAPHIAKGPGAEVEPLPPLTRMVISGDEGPRHGNPQPGIPAQLGGHRVAAVGPGIGVAPVLAAPAMDLLHLADRVSLKCGHHHPVDLARKDLDAHLGDQLFVAGRPGELPGLVQGLGQGLLSVDVQSPLHRPHGDRSVHVIGCRDVHGIEVLLLVEKLAPVLVDPDAGELVLDLSRVPEIDIHHRHELDMPAGRQRMQIRPRHARRSKAGKVKRLAGRHGGMRPKHRGYRQTGCRQPPDCRAARDS
jgi:hypothetical protein